MKMVSLAYRDTIILAFALLARLRGVAGAARRRHAAVVGEGPTLQVRRVAALRLRSRGCRLRDLGLHIALGFFPIPCQSHIDAFTYRYLHIAYTATPLWCGLGCPWFNKAAAITAFFFSLLN